MSCVSCVTHGAQAQQGETATRAAIAEECYRGKSEAEWQAMLSLDDYKSRRLAAYALGRIPVRDPATTTALATVLKIDDSSESISDSNYAADTLGRMGSAAKDAVPALVRVMLQQRKVVDRLTAKPKLETGDLSRRINSRQFTLVAMNAIGRIGLDSDETRAAIAAARQHNDARYRVQGLRAAWRIQKDPSVVEPLMRMTVDENREAAFQSALTLAEMARTHPPVGPVLIRLLAHPTADIRRAAANGLRSFGSRLLKPLAASYGADRRIGGPELCYLVGELAATVRQQSFDRVSDSADAFHAKHQTLLASTWPVLKSHLLSSQQEHRSAAADATGKLGLLVVGELFDLLQQDLPEPTVRAAVIRALIAVEKHSPSENYSAGLTDFSKQIAQRVAPSLDSDLPPIREAAFRAFAQLDLPINDTSIARQLRLGLDDPNRDIRRYAASLLQPTSSAP